MDIRSIVDKNVIFKVLDLYVNKRFSYFIEPYKQIYNIINVDLCNQNGEIDTDAFVNFIDKVDKDYKKTGLNLRVHPLISQNGWYSVRSQEVGKVGYRSKDIDCRLYLCLANEDIHKFSSYLYEKYKQVDIPFYFKIAGNESLGRKDNMVIYSSSKNLNRNIEILKELENEHPDIISRCEEPSLIVSKINSWIGYADNIVRDDHLSFSAVVSKSFSDGIEKAVKKYLDDNPFQYFDYNGNLIKGSDYLLSKVEYDNKIFNIFKKKYGNAEFKELVYNSILKCIDEIDLHKNNTSSCRVERNVVKPFLDDSEIGKTYSFFDFYPRYDFSLNSIKGIYDNYNIKYNALGQCILEKDGSLCSDELMVAKAKFAQTWIMATSYNRHRNNNDSTITNDDYYYAFNEDTENVYNVIMDTVLQQNLDIYSIKTKNILKSSLINLNYKYSSSIVDGLYSSYESINNFNTCFSNYQKYTSLKKNSVAK